MNQLRTISALKTIFSQAGPEILRERRRFEAYLEDLMGGDSFRTERMVFRHALDSDALWPLLAQAQAQAVTTDMARQAVEQLQKESRMTKEDAHFVVQCITTAMRASFDALETQCASSAQPAPPPATQTRPQPVQPVQPKQQPPAPPPVQPQPAPQHQQAPPVPQKTPVAMQVRGSIIRSGMLQIHTDQLTFTPDNLEKPVEVAFRKITKIHSQTSAQIKKANSMYFGILSIIFGVLSIIFFSIALAEQAIIRFAMGCFYMVIALLCFYNLVKFASKAGWSILIWTGKRAWSYSLTFKDEQSWRQAIDCIRNGVEATRI